MEQVRADDWVIDAHILQDRSRRAQLIDVPSAADLIRLVAEAAADVDRMARMRMALIQSEDQPHYFRFEAKIPIPQLLFDQLFNGRSGYRAQYYISAAQGAAFNRKIVDEGTLAQLNAHHAELIEPKIKEHRGRIVRTAGDGLLVLFVSAVDALRCAVEIQRAMVQRNAQIPADRRIEFRMGVNVGDIVEGSSVHGDGINVTARLEALADAGGVCVSSRVKEDAQGSLGRLGVAFEDIGQHQLKNIDHAVHIYRVQLDHAATTVKPKQALTAAPALPDKPSIAVLPFANLSSDPEQEYLVDGIVDDIITELSRFSELFVIARNSSFQYKGRATDVRQIGRELGVRYVLEGSIRRGGDRIRISAQLIDAATGVHRWAEHYDRTLEDVFAVQDVVARTIAAILAAHVRHAETERSRAKPPNSLQAYDYCLQAIEALTSYQFADIVEARRLLQLSLAIDPNYARSYAALAHIDAATWRNTSDSDFLNSVVLERAHDFVRKAVRLDRNLPQAHAGLGNVLNCKLQHDASIAAFEKAMSLNPNYVDWVFGWALICAGDSKRAIEVVHAYMRLDPFYVPPASFVLGYANYMLEQYGQAVLVLRDFVTQMPKYWPGHCALAATFAKMGHFEEARAEAAEVLRLLPRFTISGFRPLYAHKYPRDEKHLFDGFRRAGLPE
jgi:TolB-like protein/Tfp pilus assembly protein PilF